MEFIISSASLLKGILDVSKAIPAKTALPILENFLFVLKDGKMEITASDQELTLRTVVEVNESAAEGSIAVPARQIIDLLKALPDQPITIKTAGNDQEAPSNASGATATHPCHTSPLPTILRSRAREAMLSTRPSLHPRLRKAYPAPFTPPQTTR